MRYLFQTCIYEGYFYIFFGWSYYNGKDEEAILKVDISNPV